MRISKQIIFLLIFSLQFSTCYAQIGMRQLGDSLMAWTGFSPRWSPCVRIKNMRVNGNTVTLNTNITLHDVRWTEENIADLKRKVSIWVLGHEKGKITIYSGKTNIESLVTDCAKGGLTNSKCNKNRCSDLTERNVVLYPSHGLYFNRDRQEWIWQRATLWTTVEDVYSQEYVRLIKRMLENAGCNVIMPRAGLEQQELGESGMPKWTEGARQWLATNNADSTIWNIYEGDTYKDDMKCRAMWVNSLDSTVDLCVALHTDGLDSGDDSTIVGTLVIYTAKDDEGRTNLRDGRDREKVNRNLGDYIQTQITTDLRTIVPQWTRRQLKEANYCESRVPVVPSIILELLSHKNMADMRYGLDPSFRFTASRAVYKGILRYLNGSNSVVQPLPITELSIDTTGMLRWKAPIDRLEPTAEPSYYMVYIQANDGEWEVQQVDNVTQLQLSLSPGTAYNYYVVAGNEGGLSFPSPIISAYKSDNKVNDKMVLIVDAFNDVYGPEWFADSTYAGILPGSYACENNFSCAYIGQQWDYRRSSQWINDDNCGWGACYRDHAGQLIVGNTHDYSVQHGRELRKMKISYISCTEGMLNEQTVNEKNISIIDIICGRNRQPLTDTTRSLIAGYINAGGRILMSSDHINNIDPNWLKLTFHASFYADHSTHSGRISTPRHRLYQLVMEPNEEQLFSPAPQALKPEGEGAVSIATYQDMRVPAAVGFKNDQTANGKTLLYGFPLEAVQDFDHLYHRSIEWILEK